MELLNQFLDWTSHYFYQLPGEWQFIVFLSIIVFAILFVVTTIGLIFYGILILIWKMIVAIAKSIWEVISPKNKDKTTTTKK